jgi:tubulin-folding cofactor B
MTDYEGRIKNTDLLNLRDYVTAESGSLNQADSTVLLMCTHSNLKARFMEIRFDRYVRVFLLARFAVLVPWTPAPQNTPPTTLNSLPEPSRAVFCVLRVFGNPSRRACRRRLYCTSVVSHPDHVCSHPGHAPFPHRQTQMTIGRVKEKLMTHVGSNVSTMRLSLKDWDGALVAPMADDSKLLGYYSPEDGWTIHIHDIDTHSASASGWLEDVSLVKKYEMSDEEYTKRGDTHSTYRKWKNEQLKKDPTWCVEKHMAEKRGEVWVPPKVIEDDEHQADEAGVVADQIGNRCEVNPGGKRGEVLFVGKVAGLPKGWWVGVKFDEPVGKNDGAVRGERYFTCPDGYGSFQRPENVTVGDYPDEDDPFGESEDEI